MPTVLVVDDEADILEILKITLETAGYRVLTASDGAQALAAVDREIPDAMLLDVGMPNVDGWEVLERIKSSRAEALAHVPVVMITAWSSPEDQVRGGIEGAVHYLEKPFDPADVVEVLDEILDPATPSEPEMRKQVQTSSLERLARMERGDRSEHPESEGPRIHLTRLDRPAAPVLEEGFTAASLPALLESLSGRQRQVVDKLLAGGRVREISDDLGVSRSNVYAILRRVAKKVDVPDARALIHRLRRLGSTSRG